MLLYCGGTLVNAPGAMGGPGGFDVSNPFGALAIFLGAALLAPLPAGWQRAGWALGGALAAIPVLGNLWRVPPFTDVTLSWYLRQTDPAVYGAGAGWTMLGLSPLAFALVAAGSPWRGRRGRRGPVLGWAALATAVTCVAAGAFADPYGTALTEQTRIVVPCACLPPLLLAWRARQNGAAKVAGAYAFVLLGLCLAILWLDHVAWTRGPL